MSKDALITQHDLMQWSGIKRKKELIGWLLQNGIQFYYVRNGEVATTQAACDHPLVGDSHSANGKIEFI
ncbi:hypothetical protein ACH42_17305 [Endozoicomonas sp. (ex Bugula neritina AB1)]|nr:hypothetical protein ACH42_17305 [Endozoicomonas sp. (ex Bugula neritina AB1)]